MIPRTGLGVLILNKDKQILLGRRKGAHGEMSWGPPGGHIEFGESFEECAIREVLEETALKIENPKFLAVTNDFFESDAKHYISIFMTANYNETQIVQNCEPHKTEEWQWFSLNKLPDNLFLPLKQLVLGKCYGGNFL